MSSWLWPLLRSFLILWKGSLAILRHMMHTFGHGCAPRGALGPATAFRWWSHFLSPLQANLCEGCSGTGWEAVSGVLTPLALVCVVCDTNVRQDLETESVAYFPVIWKKLYFSCQQTATDKKTFSVWEVYKSVQGEIQRKPEWSDNVKSKHLVPFTKNTNSYD